MTTKLTSTGARRFVKAHLRLFTKFVLVARFVLMLIVEHVSDYPFGSEIVARWPDPSFRSTPNIQTLSAER